MNTVLENNWGLINEALQRGFGLLLLRFKVYSSFSELNAVNQSRGHHIAE